MTQLRIATTILYTKEQLVSLATMPLRYKASVECLSEFYLYVTKELYSNHAIKTLSRENNLNLRMPQDRLKFAQIAARQELDTYDNHRELEQVKVELLETKAELKASKEIIDSQQKEIQQLRLKAGKPLNGRENSPIFKIFNSPTTKDMLVSAYHKLRIKEHPDYSNYPTEIACARFSFIKKTYIALLNNWDDKCDPTLPITTEELSRVMNVELPFKPSTFVL